MHPAALVTLNMRELDRFKVIQDVADGRLKPWRAAERLGLTTRQIRRLVARLREHGPGGLVSRRRSKPSNNRLDSVKADRALSVIRERYADFGPTLACEKLRECHCPSVCPLRPAGDERRSQTMSDKQNGPSVLVYCLGKPTGPIGTRFSWITLPLSSTRERRVERSERSIS